MNRILPEPDHEFVNSVDAEHKKSRRTTHSFIYHDQLFHITHIDNGRIVISCGRTWLTSSSFYCDDLNHGGRYTQPYAEALRFFEREVLEPEQRIGDGKMLADMLDEQRIADAHALTDFLEEKN